jgi:hypothetical protein
MNSFYLKAGGVLVISGIAKATAIITGDNSLEATVDTYLLPAISTEVLLSTLTSRSQVGCLAFKPSLIGAAYYDCRIVSTVENLIGLSSNNLDNAVANGIAGGLIILAAGAPSAYKQGNDAINHHLWDFW